MTVAADILANAMPPEDSRRDLARLADAAGVKMGIALKATRGYPINPDLHLRLCAALAINPGDGAPRPGVAPGRFDRNSLGIAVSLARRLRNQSTRQAQPSVGISLCTLSQIEAGKPTSITSVLAACRYLGRSPFEFVCSPDCSAFDNDASSLNSLVNSTAVS